MYYIETVRSFGDKIGALLGTYAAALLGYLALGDWMMKNGMIGADGHFAGVVIAFICALLLTVATVMIFIERLGYAQDRTENDNGDN